MKRRKYALLCDSLGSTLEVINDCSFSQIRELRQDSSNLCLNTYLRTETKVVLHTGVRCKEVDTSTGLAVII